LDFGTLLLPLWRLQRVSQSSCFLTKQVGHEEFMEGEKREASSEDSGGWMRRIRTLGLPRLVLM